MLDRLIFASIQGLIALGGVWLICLIGRRLPATVKVWLWRLAMLKMAIALILPAPILRVLPAATAQKQVPVAALAPSQPEDMTVTLNLSDADLAAILSGTPPVQPEAPVQTAPVQAVQTAASVPPRSSSSWAWLIWAAGSLALAAAAGVALAKARRSARATLPIDDMEVEITARDAAAMAGLATMPHLRMLTHDGSPFVIGLLKPLVAVPATLLKELRALRFALLHEFAHVRRGDLRWSFAMTMMRALFWFHPLAWIAEREHRVQSEIACDDFVVRSSDSRRDYALTLVRLAVLGTPLSGGSAGLGAVGSRRTLLRRLSEMSKPFNRRFTYRAALAVGLPALVLLVPIHLAARSPQQLPANDPAVPLVVPAISPSDLDDSTLPDMEGIKDDAPALAGPNVAIDVSPKIALVRDHLLALSVAQHNDKLTPEQKAEIEKEIKKAMAELKRVLKEDLPRAMAEAKKAGKGVPDMKDLQPQIEQAIRSALAAAQKALDGIGAGNLDMIKELGDSDLNIKLKLGEDSKEMEELKHAKGAVQLDSGEHAQALQELLKAQGELKLNDADKDAFIKALIELHQAKGEAGIQRLKALEELEKAHGQLRLQGDEQRKALGDLMKAQGALTIRQGEMKELQDLNGTIEIQMDQAQKEMHDAMKQMQTIRIEDGKVFVNGKEIPLKDLKDGKIPGMPNRLFLQSDGDAKTFRYNVAPARPAQNDQGDKVLRYHVAPDSPRAVTIVPRGRNGAPAAQSFMVAPRAGQAYRGEVWMTEPNGKVIQLKGDGSEWFVNGKPLTKDQKKRLADIDAQIQKLMKERSKLSGGRYFVAPKAGAPADSGFWFAPSYPGLFPASPAPKDAPKAQPPANPEAVTPPAAAPEAPVKV